MKRVIVVNILILLMFAGISYWSQEKEKLETAVSEQAQEQLLEASGTEEEKSAEEQKQDAKGEKSFGVSIQSRSHPFCFSSIRKPATPIS